MALVNLMEVYRQCVKEMKSINMDISPYIVSVEVNYRLTRALGRCISHWDGCPDWYRIEINPCLVESGVEVKALKNTIMHELLHTCPLCMNHGPEWKRRADVVNKLLGYRVQRQTEISRLEAQGVKLNMGEWKFAMVCNDCGHMFKRKRWCKTLENSDNYRCGVCHGKLHVISLDDRLEAAADTVGN